MSERQDFFSGFKPLAGSEWKSIAINDLNGADFDDRLVWKTYEAFNVQPYYSKEDVKDHFALNSSKKESWTSYQEIIVKDVNQANREAITAISFDVKGILFHIDEQISIDKLVQELDPLKIEIAFSGQEAIGSTREYFNYLASQKYPLQEVSGFCDFDTLSQWITTDDKLILDDLVDVVRATSGARNFRCIHIHSGDFTNAGSNFTQELAFTMNKLVEYIDQLTDAGLTVAEVVENCYLDMAITGDFFFEIAKLQAMRNLCRSVLEAYGLTEVTIPILASSSRWSKSPYDHHTNMIRNTSESMSAILGGCDAILIKPHDSLNNSPKAPGQRIAANISNLLREESYFDKVDNPLSGSYYLEWLIKQLYQDSLKLFKEIEHAHGLVACIQSGMIQDHVNSTRVKKVQDLIQDRFVMVGTNKYQVDGEVQPKKSGQVENKASDGRILLTPVSMAELIHNKSIST